MKAVPIHCIATCKTCGEERQDYRIARGWAYHHSRRTGHHVLVEVAYCFHYRKPKIKGG